MRKFRRKPHAGKRGRETEPRHWLDSGRAGQESLLLELDPCLYAADQVLSTLSSSVAYRYEGDQDKPFAVLVPPTGCIGWQIGYLSKNYNVYIWAAEVDELLDQAADRFNAKLVTGETTESIDHDIDLFVQTNCSWASLADFMMAVRAAEKLVSPDGRMCFVCSGKGERDEVRIYWGDGSATLVSEIESGALFALPRPVNVHAVSLRETKPFDSPVLGAFLKRNREFFGRNMRDLFMRRMNEGDFRQSFVWGGSDTHWSCVFVWDSNSADSRQT